MLPPGRVQRMSLQFGMQKTWHLAIAILVALCSLAAPPLAAEGSDPPDLKSLRGFRIGATCAEVALSDAGNKRLRCAKAIDFHAEFLEVNESGRSETIILQFAPDGRLWAVTSQVKWQPDVAPLAADAIASMSQRFGPPSLYEDFREDAVFLKRQRKNGSTSTSYRAAWASGGTPWDGSVNVHSGKFHDCNTGPKSAIDCASSEIRTEMAAWSSRLAMLKGLVTVAEFQFEDGKAATLETSIHDPAFQRLEGLARQQRANELEGAFERARAPSMPKF